MHIIKAIRERKSEQALYETCVYLSSSNVSALEEEWIAVLSEIGMSREVQTAKELWVQCLYDVKALVDADALDVTDALVCTTKLYLLYVKTAMPHVTSLPQLRARVIDYFPSGVKLSYKGVTMFEQIIPDDSDAELHQAAHRILSGLIKLFHTHNVLTSDAVEFIARKKLVIKCRKVWPAPTPAEASKGDSVWFTWGALLLYFVNDPYVQVAWLLFCHKYKKKDKMERLGLLVGAASCCTRTSLSEDIESDMIDQSTVGWTKAEASIIENISDLAADLWAAHVPTGNTGAATVATATVAASSSKKQTQQTQQTQHDVLMDFRPTRARTGMGTAPAPAPEHIPEVKVVSFWDKKPKTARNT
jgi:hypothetical protein